MLIEQAIVALAFALFAGFRASAKAGEDEDPTGRPLAQFDLPDDWEARFWGGPTVALPGDEPESPRRGSCRPRAGLRYCRCPSCDAPEDDEPLAWSIKAPTLVTCKKCGATFPTTRFPHQDCKRSRKVPSRSSRASSIITLTTRSSPRSCTSTASVSTSRPGATTRPASTCPRPLFTRPSATESSPSASPTRSSPGWPRPAPPVRPGLPELRLAHSTSLPSPSSSNRPSDRLIAEATARPSGTGRGAWTCR